LLVFVGNSFLKLKNTVSIANWLGKYEDGGLVGKREGKRLVGRPKCRQWANIQLHHKEKYEGVWTEFAWFRIPTNLGSSDNVKFRIQ
jgi:hypothetical protein